MLTIFPKKITLLSVFSQNILIIFAFVSYATPVFSCASHRDAANTSSSSSSSTVGTEVPGAQMLKLSM